MALREKPKTEGDLSTRDDGKVDLDIRKGEYHIRRVPEKPDISSGSALFIPNINSPFLVAINAMTWVLWSLYFWYEISVIRHTQQIAGNI